MEGTKGQLPAKPVVSLGEVKEAEHTAFELPCHLSWGLIKLSYHPGVSRPLSIELNEDKNLQTNF